MDLFIRKTTAEFNNFLKSQYSPHSAYKGLFQRLIPAARLLTVFMFILSLNLSTKLISFIFWISYACLIMWASNINPFKKILSTARLTFFFTALISLPALFNFITPGEIILNITPHYGITIQGVKNVSVLFLRSFASLLYMSLLLSSTTQHEISVALSQLKVPPIFIAVFSMTLRYAVLFSDKVLDTLNATKSRIIGSNIPKNHGNFTGRLAADLFRRTSRTGNEIYDAMISRGYTGAFMKSGPSPIPARDIVWLGAHIIFLFIFKELWL